MTVLDLIQTLRNCPMVDRIYTEGKGEVLVIRKEEGKVIFETKEAWKPDDLV